MKKFVISTFIISAIIIILSIFSNNSESLNIDTYNSLEYIDSSIFINEPNLLTCI